jgi:DNA-binding response OmpR family regulator
MFTVLLVDDDPPQLRTRELVLRSQGWSVRVATNASSALALVRSTNHLALVITDHNLAGDFGSDLVRELRQIRPDMPVLVLSGMPGIEQDYAGLNVEIRIKPLPPDELISLVKSCISAG